MQIIFYACSLIAVSCLTTVSAFAQQSPAQQSPAQQSPTQQSQSATQQSPTQQSQSATQQSPTQQSQSATQQSPTQQSPAEPSPTKPPVNYTGSEVGLVTATLLVLAGLFVSVMYWSARLERTHYLATLYEDFVKDYEFKRLAHNAEQRWAGGDYHAKAVQTDPSLVSAFPEPDEEYTNSWWCRFSVADYQDSRYWRLAGSFDSGRGSGVGGLGTSPGDTKAGPQDQEAWKKEEKARNAYEKKLNEWKIKVGKHASELYEKVLAGFRKEADERTKHAINIDFGALRGRGREFVLEFTAIVVIIFSAVILGILRILQGDHIATLLAAIAGYVLGRATTRSQGAPDGTPRGETAAQTIETVKPVDTSQLTELLRVVSGSKSTPDQPPNVSITEPAVTGEQFVSTEPCVVIRGRATDDSSVTDVQWHNLTTGKSGAATLSDGTTARDWRSPELALNEGPNEITVESRDASGNRSAPAKITVKYQPSKTRTDDSKSQGKPQETGKP